MEIPRPAPKQQLPANAQRVFKGEIFDVYQWKQELFDGTTATFERLKRPDSIGVIPVLPDGQILLIDEEQPGTKRGLTYPMGRADEGEDALTTAKRELLEETGYEADEWILWDARQSVMKIDWAVFTFIAKGLRKVADLDLDAGERIEPAPVPLERFLELAENVDFAGPHIMKEILIAKADPAKMTELLKLLS